MVAHQAVHLAEPRATAQVTFSDGVVLEGPVGTPLEVFIQAYERDHNTGSAEAVAALIDGRLRELSGPVVRDIHVQPVRTDDSDGSRIYRRSLAFLLTVAAAELYPGLQIEVEHSIPSGGYFCRVHDRHPFTGDEIAALKAHMRTIVEAEGPITRRQIPLDEAKALFEACGDDDKVRLLEFRTKDYLTIYQLRNEIDYFYGYMVPNTRYLKVFDLQPESDGFVLLYPRREAPDTIRPLTHSPQLTAVFRQREAWLGRLDIEYIGSLNREIREGRAREIVLVTEALHEGNIAQIATQIAERHKDGLRLVLIAGPSSSGKTTFSKRLAIQLIANGLKPYTLEMDRYFVERHLTPRDETGEYDFEALEAVDLALFNEQLLALTHSEAVSIPHYDFVTGKRVFDGHEVQLSPEHVLIVEGIHGLNPNLVSVLPTEGLFRIYVSALTVLNIDRHNRVPTTDVRLIRRIVRDATFRGYSAIDTLARWESVRRGEKRNIFPYQENADVMFNSSLVYELAVLRPLAEPLLLQVEPGNPYYNEAKRLLAILSWLQSMNADLVPDNSLLREFIGGSILRDYMPGLR